jgi:hypothetical protein
MPDNKISSGTGTVEDPWMLKTPPLSSDYQMHRDSRDGVDAIVCTVGKTVLLYDARCIDELHAMLTAHGDWMELGSADEQKPAKDGTVEAWGRSTSNPHQGWTASRRVCAGALACTCRRCWNISASPRWNTILATIACELCS